MQLFICVHENLSVLRSATELKTFTDYPSEELLEKCAKEQLLTFVEHYSVPVTDKHQSVFEIKVIGNGSY